MELKTDEFNRKLSYIVTLQYTLIITKNMLSGSIAFFTENNSIFNIIILVSIFYLYIKFLVRFFDYIKIYRIQFLLLFLIFVFWMLSFMIHPALLDYKFLRAEVKEFLAYSLPLLLFLPSLTSREYLLQYFKRFAPYMSFVSIVCGYVLMLSPKDNIYTSYSMAYGRNAMFASILMYSIFFENRKKRYFILGTIIFILIFLVGSRFPLLCIMFYVIVKSIPEFIESKYCLIKFLFLFLVIGLIFMNNKIIVTYIYDLLKSFGIDSRNLFLLVTGKATSTSGRDVIHELLIASIKESPAYGYGAGGSIIVLNGDTAHSLLLDIYVNLGVVFGTMWILFSATLFFYAYRSVKNYSDRDLIIILLSCFLPISTLQLGLWSANMYWFLISISFSILLNK